MRLNYAVRQPFRYATPSYRQRQSKPVDVLVHAEVAQNISTGDLT
jgi:hypothetical protein